ncbi:hypothetical protein ABIE67_004328 [Streptomyces sp. V4I8]
MGAGAALLAFVVASFIPRQAVAAAEGEPVRPEGATEPAGAVKR